MSQSVTLKIDEITFNKIKDYYLPFASENSGDYVIFFAKRKDLTVTVFSSKKGMKALFNGEDALSEAKKFDLNATYNITKEVIKASWLDSNDQIGSDEVGTGDFFGPVIVVASYVSKDIIPFLKEIGVDDSKKLTDEKILKIVPLLIDKVVYSKMTCNPEKYNEMVLKGYSMNKIKAILHNETLQSVKSKIHKSYIKAYIDQFCEPKLYYSYLNGCSDPLIEGVTFKTKGESFYPSVAVSSLIARYSFIKYFEELSQKYGINFPKGASKSVDEFTIKLCQKISLEEMDKLVKKNFKNYQNLLDNK